MIDINDLIKILDKYNVSFECCCKRIDGEFVVRNVWEIDNKNIDVECEWEGFENSEDCIKDLIKQIKKVDKEI